MGRSTQENVENTYGVLKLKIFSSWRERRSRSTFLFIPLLTPYLDYQETGWDFQCLMLYLHGPAIKEILYYFAPEQIGGALSFITSISHCSGELWHWKKLSDTGSWMKELFWPYVNILSGLYRWYYYKCFCLPYVEMWLSNGFDHYVCIYPQVIGRIYVENGLPVLSYYAQDWGREKTKVYMTLFKNFKGQSLSRVLLKFVVHY